MLPMPFAFGAIAKLADGKDLPVGAGGQIHQITPADMIGALTENKMLLIYIGAGVFGVALVVVVLVILIKRIKNPNLKHKNLVHELAHEHKLTKTTQIPRKTIFDVTKPTNSFLNCLSRNICLISSITSASPRGIPFLY